METTFPSLSPLIGDTVLLLLLIVLIFVVPVGARWRNAAWPASMPPLASHRPGDLLYTPRTPYWRAPADTHDLRRGSWFASPRHSAGNQGRRYFPASRERQ